MNAYELAVVICNCTTDPLHKEVATMLRQQADHIIKLGDDLFAERRECLKLENRIAELEKLLEEMKYEKSSGVYDYPVKQLSDEDIGQIFADNLSFMVRTKEDADNLILCAKAIIKEITE